MNILFNHSLDQLSWNTIDFRNTLDQIYERQRTNNLVLFIQIKHMQYMIEQNSERQNDFIDTQSFEFLENPFYNMVINDNLFFRITFHVFFPQKSIFESYNLTKEMSSKKRCCKNTTVVFSQIYSIHII